MIELREVGEDGEPVRTGALRHVLRIQQRRDIQLTLRYIEHQPTVPLDVLRVEGCEVDKVGAEPVQDRAEGQPVLPAGAHVADLNPRIALGDPPGPHLQRPRPLQRHPIVFPRPPPSSFSLLFTTAYKCRISQGRGSVAPAGFYGSPGCTNCVGAVCVCARIWEKLSPR